MNTTWRKLFIVPLLLAALAAPLCAQTNASTDSRTNTAVPAPAATPPVQSMPQPTLAPPVAPAHNGPDNIRPEDMVAIMGIFGVFGGGTVIVGLFLYFRHRRNKILHETLRSMIEKGVNIPPELLSGPLYTTALQNRTGPRNDFRTGLILIGVGAALMIMMKGSPEMRQGPNFGLIPLFIGIAFLISWVVEKMKKDQPGK